MNANSAWTYMINILSGEFQERGPEHAADRAAAIAAFHAMDAGKVSKTPRIHLAAKAK